MKSITLRLAKDLHGGIDVCLWWRRYATAGVEIQQRIAFAETYLPIAYSGFGDIDQICHTGSQSSYERRSDPARGLVEQGQEAIACAFAIVNGAHAVRVFALRMPVSMILEIHQHSICGGVPDRAASRL